MSPFSVPIITISGLTTSSRIVPNAIRYGLYTSLTFDASGAICSRIVPGIVVLIITINCSLVQY